jgi:dihydroflavonol-4-reductase
MRVLVTGGTGFIGAAAVAALTAAGHECRLLVRRPARLAPALAEHDAGLVDRVAVVLGDATDAAAVRTAVEGCEAVVHAAAVFSFDVGRQDEVRRTNLRAADVVLRAGVAAGCDPVVHVSSTAALLRRDGDTAGLPLGDALRRPYGISKVESERVARELQDAGAAVATLYPGSTWGPGDHFLGENSERLRWLARGWFPLWPPGGMHCVDVRDAADCVTALVQPGKGASRYVVPGHHVDADLVYGTVSRLLGRRRPHVVVPAPLLRPLSAGLEQATRPLPPRWRVPAEREAVEFCLCDNRFDDAPARRDLGVEPRDWDVVVADTLSWLVDRGHLPSRYRPSVGVAVPV